MESTDIKQEPEELGVSVIKDELSDLEMIKDDLLINIDIPECIENSTYFHDSVEYIPLNHKKNELYCDRCNFRTNSKISWNDHLHLHSEEDIHSCDECGFRTINYNSMQKHKLFHTTKKLYKCSYCGLRTRYKCTLNYHKMIHLNIKPFQCNICNFSTRSKQYLKDHKMRNHNVNLFQCDICDFSTFSQPTLKYHKMTHHNLKLFHCDVCKFKTRSKYYIRQHMLLHQSGNKELKDFEGLNMEENVTKVCRICLQKIGEGIKFHYLNTKRLKLQWKLTDSLPEFDLNPVICNPCVTEMIGTGSTTKKMLAFTNDIKEERDAEGSINVTEQKFLSCVKQEPGVEIIKEEFGMDMIKEEVTLYPPAPISSEEPTYYCHDCGYGTKTKKYLVQHIFKHQKKNNFQCNFITELKRSLKKQLASYQVPSSS